MSKHCSRTQGFKLIIHLDAFPLNGHPPSLYYKRVDRVGSSSTVGDVADTHGKVRASPVFVSYSLHVSIVGFFFIIRHKRIRGGGAFAECNSASLKQRWLLL